MHEDNGRPPIGDLSGKPGRWWSDEELAAHDREVAAKAWDEGARHVYTEGGKCSFARDGDPCPYNPYREGGQ